MSINTINIIYHAPYIANHWCQMSPSDALHQKLIPSRMPIHLGLQLCRDRLHVRSSQPQQCSGTRATRFNVPGPLEDVVFVRGWGTPQGIGQEPSKMGDKMDNPMMLWLGAGGVKCFKQCFLFFTTTLRMIDSGFRVSSWNGWTWLNPRSRGCSFGNALSPLKSTPSTTAPNMAGIHW